MLYTPGHTDDSYSFLLPDRVFTGDTLLIRGTGRTEAFRTAILGPNSTRCSGSFDSPMKPWCFPPTTTRATP